MPRPHAIHATHAIPTTSNSYAPPMLHDVCIVLYCIVCAVFPDIIQVNADDVAVQISGLSLQQQYHQQQQQQQQPMPISVCIIQYNTIQC